MKGRGAWVSGVGGRGDGCHDYRQFVCSRLSFLWRVRVCLSVCVCTAGLFHQLSVRLCPSLTVRQVVSPLQSFGGGSGVPSFAFPSPLTAGGGSTVGAFLSPFPLRLCIASVCVCVRSLNLAYVG